MANWSDPNVDSHGSYLLRRGRSRAWEVPPRTRGNIFKKHYRAAGFVDAQGKVDFDAEGTYDTDSEVFTEMMDVAERHWDEVVVDWLTRQRQRHPSKSFMTASERSRTSGASSASTDSRARSSGVLPLASRRSRRAP